MALGRIQRVRICDLYGERTLYGRQGLQEARRCGLCGERIERFPHLLPVEHLRVHLCDRCHDQLFGWQWGLLLHRGLWASV